MSPRPRALIVTPEFPWPPRSGLPIRLGMIVDALSQMAEVELFSLVRDEDPRPAAIPPSAHLARWTTAPYAFRPAPLAMFARMVSRRPLEVALACYGPARASLFSWARPQYELTWFSTAATYVSLGSPLLGPTVVDLADLEDQKMLGLLRILSQRLGYHPLSARELRRTYALHRATAEAKRWTRLQAGVAGRVDAIVVCSNRDAQNLQCANGHVVPNGYPRPSATAGRLSVGSPPTVLFQGLLHYAPNVDGAQWLIGEVAPLLRRTTPDVQFRLVGKPHPAVERLHAPPMTVVTGAVPEMWPELRGADVVAVPIRFGGGTRIKILEAFAHRIPVVSTTLGAEGLEVIPGRHLLVADTAQAFAAACSHALQDSALRERLTAEAHRLYLDTYEVQQVRDSITALARNLVGTEVPGP